MFHFTAWPDKGVPKKYDEFVTFLEDSREHGKQSDTPIIVHCSAGVGRTGVRLTRERLFQVSDVESSFSSYFETSICGDGPKVFDFGPKIY